MRKLLKLGKYLSRNSRALLFSLHSKIWIQFNFIQNLSWNLFKLNISICPSSLLQDETKTFSKFLSALVVEFRRVKCYSRDLKYDGRSTVFKRMQMKRSKKLLFSDWRILEVALKRCRWKADFVRGSSPPILRGFSLSPLLNEASGEL